MCKCSNRKSCTCYIMHMIYIIYNLCSNKTCYIAYISAKLYLSKLNKIKIIKSKISFYTIKTKLLN